MTYDSEQITRIKEYVTKFNKTIVQDDSELLEYAVEAVIDRALLYLNRKSLDERFSGIWL